MPRAPGAAERVAASQAAWDEPAERPASPHWPGAVRSPPPGHRANRLPLKGLTSRGKISYSLSVLSGADVMPPPSLPRSRPQAAHSAVRQGTRRGIFVQSRSSVPAAARHPASPDPRIPPAAPRRHGAASPRRRGPASMPPRPLSENARNGPARQTTRPVPPGRAGARDRFQPHPLNQPPPHGILPLHAAKGGTHHEDPRRRGLGGQEAPHHRDRGAGGPEGRRGAGGDQGDRHLPHRRVHALGRPTPKACSPRSSATRARASCVEVGAGRHQS